MTLILKGPYRISPPTDQVEVEVVRVTKGLYTTSRYKENVTSHLKSQVRRDQSTSIRCGRPTELQEKSNDRLGRSLRSQVIEVTGRVLSHVPFRYYEGFSHG